MSCYWRPTKYSGHSNGTPGHFLAIVLYGPRYILTTRMICFCGPPIAQECVASKKLFVKMTKQLKQMHINLLFRNSLMRKEFAILIVFPWWQEGIFYIFQCFFECNCKRIELKNNIECRVVVMTSMFLTDLTRPTMFFLKEQT